jgi:hypothetical protein
VDHLVYGVRNLEAGIDAMERLLGVRAVLGGKHPGGGTHNALLSLGRGSYLEIIAPDMDQPDPAQPRPFGLDTLREPRLITWATRVQGIERVAESARLLGYDPGPAVPMSRSLPDGSELNWRLTLPDIRRGDGLVPFLIEWEPGRHPSETAPEGCHLRDLEGEHPHPDDIQRMLSALDIEVSISGAGRPALIATIDCPRGEVVLS